MRDRQKQILMIQADANIRSALEIPLCGEGYSVATAASLDSITVATTHSFDLIVIDIGPTVDGLNICHRIRQAGIATPMLVLSDRNRMTDKLLGFKLGADDYVTKPFHTAELLARIEALLRRVRPGSPQSSEPERAITIDVQHSRVMRNGEPVFMTAHEFQLLDYLVKRSGRCISRGELLRTVWRYASNSSTRTIDMHIASLRRKLEVNPKSPKHIITIPKLGYMFVASSGHHSRR